MRLCKQYENFTFFRLFCNAAWPSTYSPMTQANKRLDGQSYFSFREELVKRGIIFSYSGFLNEEILTGIGNALRTKLTIDKIDAKVSRGIFSAFVEQVQNVIRYSAETNAIIQEDKQQDDGEDHAHENESLPYGMVTIGEYPDSTRFVACCYMIGNADTEKLTDQLESIRGLDRKQLGAIMREQLKNSQAQGAKGAGLGFVSIAREVNGNWEYDIVRNDAEEFDFFCFEAHVWVSSFFLSAK